MGKGKKGGRGREEEKCPLLLCLMSQFQGINFPYECMRKPTQPEQREVKEAGETQSLEERAWRPR